MEILNNANRESVTTVNNELLSDGIYCNGHSQITSAPTRYTPNFCFYKNDTIIGQSIQLYGEYTETEIDLLNNFINKESVIYDIGANIGYHTLAFASRAKHVYSFEPNNKNYELLKKNTMSWTNTTLIHAACSDNTGNGHISDFSEDSPGNYGECMLTDSGQECPLVTIDSMKLPAPSLIKIDVEGHELNVFRGAIRTITEHRPVIFYESMHGTGFDLIYDMLKNLEYNIYYFPAQNFNPTNYARNTVNVFGNGGVINCLATFATVTGLPEMSKRGDTYGDALSRFLS